MTEIATHTTPEVGGMGHSVKRKEDPRFIRARAATSTTSSCRACSSSTSSAARTPTRRSRASTRPRRSRSRASSRSSPARTSRRPACTGCRRWPATSRWCCRPTTVMYQAQEVAAVVATTRYAAADGVAAVDVDYEPLPVIVDPFKALEPDAFVLRPDRGAGQAEQPHLALGVGRPGGHADAALAAADVRVERGHLHPAHPRRLDRDVRLRRRLGPGPAAS